MSSLASCCPEIRRSSAVSSSTSEDRADAEHGSVFPGQEKVCECHAKSDETAGVWKDDQRAQRLPDEDRQLSHFTSVCPPSDYTSALLVCLESDGESPRHCPSVSCAQEIPNASSELVEVAGVWSDDYCAAIVSTECCQLLDLAGIHSRCHAAIEVLQGEKTDHSSAVYDA